MSVARDPRITRRRFVFWSVAGLLAALSLASLFARSGLPRNSGSLLKRLSRVHQTPQAKLLAYFHYLKIPDDVADQFVADFSMRVRDVGRLSQLDDDFYERFLLSTDFFQYGADESRELGYVAIYGPTVTLCYNPLARLD